MGDDDAIEQKGRESSTGYLCEYLPGYNYSKKVHRHFCLRLPLRSSIAGTEDSTRYVVCPVSGASTNSECQNDWTRACYESPSVFAFFDDCIVGMPWPRTPMFGPPSGSTARLRFSPV